MCEAERRNKQALYELTLQRGNGVIDLPKLRALLTGDCDCTDPHTTPSN
jgi:hypothetical protein